MGKGKKLNYNEVVERVKKIIANSNFDIIDVNYTTMDDKNSKVLLKCSICGSLTTFRIKSLCCTRKHNLSCLHCNFNEKVKRCRNEAKKYKKRSDFEINSNSEYLFLQRNGLLDDVCSHMERGGNKYRRLIYSYRFTVNGEKYIYVGLTYNMGVRDKAHHKQGSTVYKFCEEYGISIPQYVIETDYLDKDDASRMEGKILQRYISDGYIPLNQIRTGGLGGNTKSHEYTIEELKSIASSYKNRSEWKKSKDIAYYFAERRCLLDEVIPKSNKHRLGNQQYYTYEKCKEIIDNYPTGTLLKDLYTNNPQCYSAIRKNNWYELLQNFVRLKKSVCFTK